mmetsp:Transcript_23948/g.35635  ORF Transcript_23948/g.35635 Transcript_23948/m.35635 type:complete len:1562 (-) Transcript_23948:95-4780(-)
MLNQADLEAAMLTPADLAAISAAVNASTNDAQEIKDNSIKAGNKNGKNNAKNKITREGVVKLPYMKLFHATNISSSSSGSLVDSIIAEQEFFERTLALKKTLPSTKEKEKDSKDGKDEANANNGTKKNNKNSGNKSSSKKEKQKKDKPTLTLSEKREEALKKAQDEALKQKIKDHEQMLANICRSTRDIIIQHSEYITTNNARMENIHPPHENEQDSFLDLMKAGRDEFFDAQQALLNTDLRLNYIREATPIVQSFAYTRDDIIQLPYLQSFQAIEDDSKTGKNVILALLQEQQMKELHAALEQAYKKASSGAANENSSAAEALLRAIKEQEEILDTIVESTSAVVQKHYRKKSVRIHPDRRGEEFRPMFEDFTRARNVLKNNDLRQRYVKEMAQIVKSFGGGFIERSHKAWNEKHKPDEEDGGPKVNSEKNKGMGGEGNAGQREKQLVLEGGLFHQIPRAPMVRHGDDTKGGNGKHGNRKNGNDERTTTVWVNALKPAHEFYPRVKSISVIFEISYKDQNDIKTMRRKLKIEKEDIVKFVTNQPGYGMVYEDCIKVGSIQLPMCGTWYVTWTAQLDNGSSLITTPSSADTSLHIIDQKMVEALRAFERYEKQCIIVAAELKAGLQKMRTGADSFSSDVTRRYGFFHELVVRAGKKVRNLKGAARTTGKISKVLMKVESLLDQSRQRMKEMGNVQEKAAKKDSLRAFKRYVAIILESASPIEWMRTVTKKDLKEVGGDSNRLYQLFIEGKGKVQLMVDSDMLESASLRSDLFSAKQCNELNTKRGEVYGIEIQEEEDTRAAEERRQRDEEHRQKLARQAELGRKWSMVSTMVQISGLESVAGQKLNGKIARVVDYLVDKDRFKVCCINKGGEESEAIAIKPDNIKSYSGKLPSRKSINGTNISSNKDTWTCSFCTFIHHNDGRSKSCNVCGNPREHRENDYKEHKSPVQTEEQVFTATDSISSSRIAKTSSEERSTNKSIRSKQPISPRSPRNSRQISCRYGRECRRFRESCCQFIHNESMEILRVKASIVQRIIGHRGRNKQDIMTKSGAHIVIETDAQVNGEIPVYCTGSASAVKAAVSLISEIISRGKVETVEKSITSHDSNSIQARDKELFPPSLDNNADHHNIIGSDEAEPSPLFEPQAKERVQSYDRGNTSNSNVAIETVDETSLPRSITARPKIPAPISCTSSVSSIADMSGLTTSKLQLDPRRQELLHFLVEQNSCIKGNANIFFQWLVESEDITSLLDLAEAVSDDDYLQDMQNGDGSVGLKGFKRKTFKKAVLQFAESCEASYKKSELQGSTPPLVLHSSPTTEPALVKRSQILNDPSYDNGLSSDLDAEEGPSELYCPISHVLMVNDPVIAADSITYERNSIESWFKKKKQDIMLAQENLRFNPYLEKELEIVNCGITSPFYNTRLASLTLTANISIRNMARDFADMKRRENEVNGGVSNSSLRTFSGRNDTSREAVHDPYTRNDIQFNSFGLGNITPTKNVTSTRMEQYGIYDLESDKVDVSEAQGHVCPQQDGQQIGYGFSHLETKYGKAQVQSEPSNPQLPPGFQYY